MALPPDSDRLPSFNIHKKLKLIIVNFYSKKDKIVQTVSLNLLTSFKEWVNCIHDYRHGQHAKNYKDPSLDLTILILTSGASYLRYLASIDNS